FRHSVRSDRAGSYTQSLLPRCLICQPTRFAPPSISEQLPKWRHQPISTAFDLSSLNSASQKGYFAPWAMGAQPSPIDLAESEEDSAFLLLWHRGSKGSRQLPF